MTVTAVPPYPLNSAVLAKAKSSTKALAALLIMFVGQATIICCLDTKPSTKLPAGCDDKTLETIHFQPLLLLRINSLLAPFN